ncbi:MAG TPA: Ig-like domain-containing protein [Candidatus Ozemobacteraceae bacterium]|nr:Ig-like domain-containing protein [Candidatus Ozemobacteraceae bacterium]
MRKILALFLVIALVPFLTGCRIDGLWGYDDDGSSAVSAPANLRLAINLPAAFNIASIRSAAQTSNYVVKVKVKSEYGIWQELTSTFDNISNKYVFYITSLTSDMVELDGAGKFQFMIEDKYNPAKVIAFSAGVITASAETSECLIEIATANATVGGNLSLTVYTSTSGNLIVVAGGTVTTNTSAGTTTGQVSLPTEAYEYLSIAGIQISDNGGNAFQGISFNAANPTNIAATDMNGAIIKITFSDAGLASVTEGLSVTVNNVTLTQADGLTLAYDSPTKTLTITVTKNVALTAGTQYSLTINSATVNLDGKGLKLPMTGYFKTLPTDATRLMSWPGSDGHRVSCSSGSTMNLIFSGPLQSPQLINAVFRYERYTNDGITKEATTDVAVTSNVGSGNAGTVALSGTSTLVVTTGKALAPDRIYKVYLLSGTIKDANGADVAVYPNPMVFRTEQ